MVDGILESRTARPWESERTGAECDVYIGEGSSALEVVVTEKET